jgi:hypothetical protein
MAIPSVPSGECVFCKWGGSCTLTQHRDRPVWFCEEFDQADVLPDRTPAYRPQAAQIAADQQSASAGTEGLCADCEKRPTCTFTKLEGGVWHCEEYS